MRRLWFLTILLLLVAQSGICLADEEYRSPYSVKLPWSAEELIPDLLDGERGMVRNEAKISEFDWYGRFAPIPGMLPVLIMLFVLLVNNQTKGG